MKLNIKGDKYFLKHVEVSRISIGMRIQLLISADCSVKVGRDDLSSLGYGALRLHVQLKSDEAYNCVVEHIAEDEFEKVLVKAAVFMQPTSKSEDSRWVWYDGICVIKSFLKEGSTLIEWDNPHLTTGDNNV
jgi:hypothetical protein